MRKAIITIGLTILLVAGQTTAKDFYADGNIITGEFWSSASVYDTPPNHTTVNMTGGKVTSMHTYDSSIFNMTGGQIYNLYSYEFSTANISGNDHSSPFYIYANDQSVVNFSGTAEVLNAYALNDSIININGGTIRWLAAEDEGIINIYGGNLTEIWTHENASINIYGHHDLMKFSSGGMNGYGFVQGYFNNLTWFHFDFSSAETYSHINLIPEPATILLLVVGGLFLRKKD